MTHSDKAPTAEQPLCRECDSALDRREGPLGVSYQCLNFECGSTYAPDEIFEDLAMTKPPEPVDARLWCLHHIGPDEVHPAPDFATAQKWADWANERFADHWDVSRFVVAIWPWSETVHADGLTASIEEWTLPEPTEQAAPAPFKREDRYIVVKRSHISQYSQECIEKAIFSAIGKEVEWNGHRHLLNNGGQVACVVVEKDWPEYEPVWKMIEARVSGTAHDQ